MKLSLIVAVARNGVIGSQGQLPWRLSEDLKRFKRITMGHHIIMGRKTYESIGRPLPGRTSVIVTRQPDYEAPGSLAVPSMEEALAVASSDDEAFIVGGAEIYALALPQVSRIYLTTVDASVSGDTRFPQIDRAAWQVVSSSSTPADEQNEFPHTFELLERVASTSSSGTLR